VLQSQAKSHAQPKSVTPPTTTTTTPVFATASVDSKKTDSNIPMPAHSTDVVRSSSPVPGAVSTAVEPAPRLSGIRSFFGLGRKSGTHTPDAAQQRYIDGLEQQIALQNNQITELHHQVERRDRLIQEFEVRSQVRSDSKLPMAFSGHNRSGDASRSPSSSTRSLPNYTGSSHNVFRLSVMESLKRLERMEGEKSKLSIGHDVHINHALRAVLDNARGISGWLSKRRPSNRLFNKWKSRFVVLLGTHLVYYASADDPNPKGALSLGSFQPPQLIDNGTEDAFIRLTPLSNAEKNVKHATSPVDLRAVTSNDTRCWLEEIQFRLLFASYINGADSRHEPACAELIQYQLQQGITSLQIMHSEDHIVYGAIQYFCDHIRIRKPPESLVIRNSGLSDRTVEILTRLFTGNRVTKVLDLGDNCLTSRGAKAIAHLLRQKCTIKSVNLSFNRLGDDGVEVLADSLAECPTLSELDLCGVNMTHLGVEALLQSFAAMGSPEFPYTLRTLNLCSNAIGDRGCAAIAGLIASGAAVERVLLDQNYISDVGAEHLASAIRGVSPCTIRELSLAGNLLTDVGACQLVNAFASVTTPDSTSFEPGDPILTLTLSDNPSLGVETLTAFEDSPFGVRLNSFSIARIA
jgi:PH domain/Leucine Rich repeat